MQTCLKIAGIAIVMSVISCSSEPAAEILEKFQVILPLVVDQSITLEYVADIQAKQNVIIRSKLRGFIEAVYVDEGQFVKNGQLLFKINSSLIQQEVLRSKAVTQAALADLKSVEIEYENAQKLFEKNIISKSELSLLNAKVEGSKAKVEEAKANEEQAKLQLSFTEIRAPFDGILNRIPLKVGSLVEEGTELTSISNNQEVFAYFNVSEKDYLEMNRTREKNDFREVSLILVDGSMYPYKGVIETSESEFDASTGNIAFRARFPNPNRLLKHGLNGKIQLEKKLRNALCIPQKSTFEIQDQIYVFVVTQDQVLEQRNIQVSYRIPHLYIVEKGLNPQDQILFEGIQNVKSGMKIISELTAIPDSLNSKNSSNRSN